MIKILLIVVLGVCAGCESAFTGRTPNLRFGVVSDIHLTTPASCARLEKALRYFRSRRVDAVVMPGDLSDYGTRTGWLHLKRTWDKVFAGTGTVPLFCTGNHDHEGWRYEDMEEDMLANGYDGHDVCSRLGMAKTWEEVFGEKYAPIRIRTVKGYDFVSVENRSESEFPTWMEAHAERFKGTKPFFHFQHLPVKNTTMDSYGKWTDGSGTKEVLSKFSNCVSFTGHTHAPFNDERAIWQDGYTAVTVPSLSHAGAPSGFENGADARGKSTLAMQLLPNRRDWVGGQGYLVSVFDHELIVERRELEVGVEAGRAWCVPLPVADCRPYTYAAREKVMPAPVFPAGAQVVVGTANTENRRGDWTIVYDFRFPSATMPDGSRVHDYEIRAVPKDGSTPLVKRFYSPAFAKLAKDEPIAQRFWFSAREVPRDKDLVFEVYARNCFGKCSRPLVSSVHRYVLAEQAPNRR